ncbi:MAG: 30S ribosomal protein S12 methylthiotransferase RimO [Verrucomicrobiota bacterium]
MPTPPRVGLISLGCAKNLVDAETMLGALMQSGVEITNDPASADVVIVNTCSFIDSAQEESVEAILESAALRDTHQPTQGLIVAGCLPQRFRADLPKLFPEVDVFMGVDQVPKIGDIVRQAIAHRAQKLAAGKPRKAAKGKVLKQLAQWNAEGKAGVDDAGDAVRGTGKFGKTRAVLPAPVVPMVEVHLRPTYIQDYATPRFRLTPRHFTYLKIAEGCNHPCSFCVIPRMRGGYRSRSQPDIVAEARALLADGVKELNLISQDSTYYGLDLRTNRQHAIASPERFKAAARELPAHAATLSSLLRELNALRGDFWIRLLYTHPAHWTDELIQTIAECPKVARYVDIPLQHIHHNMLERMRRETSQQYIVDLLAKIRAGIPGIAIRTTFIVGFPGETDAYFNALLEFIRVTRFERLGVFAYSREAGTRAGQMAGQIPDKIRQRRRELAMAEQHQVARQVAAAQVGRVLKVLVEGEAGAQELKQANVSSWEHGLIRESDGGVAALRGHYAVARGEADAPDIDGRIYVRAKLPAGEFARVKIIGHTDYDLIAQPA